MLAYYVINKERKIYAEYRTAKESEPYRKSEFFPDFQIILPDRRTETLISRLTEVWESSVRSTHLFLSEEEIRRISGFVPRALREIPHLIALRDEQKELAGFMGIGQGKLEMLFLAPEQMGKAREAAWCNTVSTASAFAKYASTNKIPPRKSSMNSWDLPSIKRTERDEQGGPYPLLYMRLT